MRVVSLVSGGMDSCTTAGRLSLEGFEVYPIFVDYSQRALRREHKAAALYVEDLRHRLDNVHELEVAYTRLPFLRSSLVGTAEVTKATDPDFGSMDSKKIDWVPARNIILISIAASYCEAVNAGKISIGAYKEDEMPPYPDSSREFFDEMQLALSKGMYGQGLEITTPFIDSFKWDMIRYARDNSLPTELTWSCYEDAEAHCGDCRNCVDRKKAFLTADVEDPTKYAG